MVRKLIVAAVLASAPVIGLAAGGGGHVEKANVDISNEASLQRGAKYFVNYCLGCHSAKYVRYNRLAIDLGLTEDQLVENLMYTGERPFDTMDNAIPEVDSSNWFGRTPPDLSLTARARGSDWVYSFLKSFYLDPSKPTGSNNLVLQGASMPHVLWELQGYQRAIFSTDENGTRHFESFEQVTPGSLSTEEFDQFARDTANFMQYISEPVRSTRRVLGVWVLIFLVFFWIIASMLKKQIWKDVT
jgi:ubiquinol-cytochrome c reductase cytochrome c1 subunit